MTATSLPCRTPGEFTEAAPVSTPLNRDRRASFRRRTPTTDVWSELFAGVAAARDRRAS
ncbi:hypothetical protein ACWEOI_26460 [Nocardia sp. NPDC004340]|uniref:hypothetical protein n=1 Tax=Nocardia sp. CA-136227 TaxID=3239979 RepID=UPI003D99284A